MASIIFLVNYKKKV